MHDPPAPIHGRHQHGRPRTNRRRHPHPQPHPQGLAEFTATSGNFPTVTRVLLSKIPPQDGKMSYVYDKYVFHYVVDVSIS